MRVVGVLVMALLAAVSHPVFAIQEVAATPEVNWQGLSQKVIEAGRKENQVQKHLDYLTNRIGPRLTGSEGLQAGCEWARDEFASMGLESRLEQWGEFPVGFERGPATGMMVSPTKMTLEFGTNAWSAGTTGRDLGNAVLSPKSME
jgi:carboxypeptidase Q